MLALVTNVSFFFDIENDTAWLEDDEFARQILAGLNPIVIQRITVFF